MDSEIWKDIEECRGLYQISNKGRVKSVARVNVDSRGRRMPVKEKVLKASVKRGYLQVNIRNHEGKKIFRHVHRLVAIAFIPNPENLAQVNHKDFDKLNNDVSNLEWMSAKDNIRHFIDSDRCTRKGEGSQFSAITESLAVSICEMLQSGAANLEVAENLETTVDVVSKIHSGQSWRHVSKNYTFPNYKKRAPFTKDEVLMVADYFSKGYTVPQLLGLLDTSRYTESKLYSIRKRKSYTQWTEGIFWPKYCLKLSGSETIETTPEGGRE